ncbi:arylamine N-acetyltransferase family protein [Nocardioides sp. LHG3406-4]|uniref:arylamine N-acetyltransferase family protein n=1 Tax=Nocardioides sp. LHG3406-4 TaxID=2804575 RepID=UPI003CE76F96
MTMSELAAAYLSRLGIAEAPPTLATLEALHRAHLELLPYNNLDIMLGSPQPVDEAACLRQVVETGRSGYCFHQNGALGAGLQHLGFTVERRHGHVWSDPGARDGADLNHLVLVVSGLPTEANPGGRWWPDAGLGEGFLDPLPLLVGSHHDGLLAFEINELDDAGWSFGNDPRGSFTGMAARSLPMDVPGAHAVLSTPPDGHFARLLVVQRRSVGALDTVRGCVHTRIDAGGTTQRDLTTYDDWHDALVSVGLSLSGVEDDRLRGLWDTTWRAHVAWDAAGRP